MDSRQLRQTAARRPAANPFPVGSAILWSPFYAVADAVCRAQRTEICEGYSSIYLHAVLIATVFWATIGLFLNVGAIERLGGRAGRAWLCAIVLALASPLAFYVLLQADYSHANSYFAASVLLYLTVRARKTDASPLIYLWCGVAWGLAFLVRWQDAMLGAVPLASIVAHARGIAPRVTLVRLVLLISGALVAAAPQLVFWSVLYGTRSRFRKDPASFR